MGGDRGFCVTLGGEDGGDIDGQVHSTALLSAHVIWHGAAAK